MLAQISGKRRFMSDETYQPIRMMGPYSQGDWKIIFEQDPQAAALAYMSIKSAKAFVGIGTQNPNQLLAMMTVTPETIREDMANALLMAKSKDMMDMILEMYQWMPAVIAKMKTFSTDIDDNMWITASLESLYDDMEKLVDVVAPIVPLDFSVPQQQEEEKQPIYEQDDDNRVDEDPGSGSDESLRA
jgi:hypothetical protein